MKYCLFTYLGEVEKYNKNIYCWNGEFLNKKEDKLYLKYLKNIFDIQVIYLFTTEKILHHITEFFKHFGIEENEINDYIGRKILENLKKLEQVFEQKTNIKLKIKVKKENLEEKDLKEITNIIKCLNKNKFNILFDITHSYRDIPLFYLSLVNLVKSARDFSINMDFLYVREVEEGKANIELLDEIKEFQSWSYAISLMKKSFNLSLLAELIEKYSENIAKNLKNIHLYFSLNLLSFLQKEIKNLKNNLEKDEQFLPISYFLIKKDLNQFINRFNKNSFAEFQKEIWKFSFENKIYDKAFLALREYIISMLTSYYYSDIKNHKNRENIELLISCRKYLKNELNIPDDIINFLATITNSRNLIAHLKGYKSLERRTINFVENIDFQKLEENLETLKIKITEHIDNIDKLEEIVEYLKNHWEENCKFN